MDKRLFGQRLKEIRKNKNLTQEQLAEMIEKDDKHISALERGIHFPSFDTLEKLSKALDVQLHELFFFEPFRDNKFLYNESLKMLQNADEKQLKQIYYFLSAIMAG